MATTHQDEAQSPPNDLTVFWFAYLDQAIRDGDYADAAKAQAELQALGVEVRYRPRPKQQQGVARV